MGFSIVRKRKARFPGLLISKPVWDDIGKAAVASISQNVALQQQADGSSIKPNPPGYKAYKESMGWGGRSLVRRNKSFLRKSGALASFVYELKQKSISILPSSKMWASKKGKKATLASFRNDIVPGVQGRGYVGWFALGEKGAKKIREIIRKFIRDEFKKAREKSAKV